MEVNNTSVGSPKLIVKRDGSIVEFDRSKVEQAIAKAFDAVGRGPVGYSIQSLVTSILDPSNPNCVYVGSGTVTIEQVQNCVEQVLLDNDYRDVAKAYMLYRQERANVRASRRMAPKDAMQGYIHASKYAKYLPEFKRRETYDETVTRVKNMHLRKFPQLADDIEQAFKHVYEKRVLPSMRSMQFAGAPARTHNARLYNCTFTLLDRIRAFQEAFYLLLCGCGVGYSIQYHHVERLPSISVINKREVRHFKVPDSIEGWADSLGWLMQSATEGWWVEFDYSDIRPEGAPLSSGGRAPGHLPLRNALELSRDILMKSQGRQLRPIECHDIMCHVAEAVLSGGIRRSSMIALFSPDDGEMMRAKTNDNFRPAYGGDVGINAHRQMANNSAVFLRNELEGNKRVFDRTLSLSQECYGEPGFYFSDNEDYGTNPCGEIGLHPTITLRQIENMCFNDKHRYFTITKQEYDKLKAAAYDANANGSGSAKQFSGFAFCNLCEVNVAACTSEVEFYSAVAAATVIGTLQASYTDFPYLGKVTEAIAARDALLGVGLCGMCDNPAIAFSPSVLRNGARVAVEVNEDFAAKVGILPSARITTVKPGGTAPLELGGVGSGIHEHHARRYFRRVTANPLELPAVYFKKHNPHMVETKPNGDWSIVFPVEAPVNSVTLRESTATDFIDRVSLVYENWVVPGTRSVGTWRKSFGLTHNVSCTCTVRDGEMTGVLNQVWRLRKTLAAMSFAPLSLDKSFPYAPREAVINAVDEARWNELIKHYKPVDWSRAVEDADGTEQRTAVACSGGACEL